MAGVKRQEYEVRRSRVIEMLEDGATLQEIKTALGYKSYYQIYKIRDEINETRENALRIKHHKYEGYDDEVVQMRMEGATQKEIASFFGFKSVSSVARILQKYNLVDDASNKEKRNRQIIDARKNGASMNTLANQFNLTSTTVSKICTAAGLGGKMAEVDYGHGVCELCGAQFKKKTENQKFCTAKCQKTACWRRNDPLRNKRFKGAIIDKDITLHKLYRLSGGVCYLCGGKCDWSDTVITNGKRRSKSSYPSIDHVVPLSKGGEHSWNNVRLAHLGCNSSKGAR